jgi:hypothetical protein
MGQHRRARQPDEFRASAGQQRPAWRRSVRPEGRPLNGSFPDNGRAVKLPQGVPDDIVETVLNNDIRPQRASTIAKATTPEQMTALTLELAEFQRDDEIADFDFRLQIQDLRTP